MTQTEKAALLGISANYLSMIYNGKRRPGWKLVERWKPIIGKDFAWWQKAKTKQVQTVIKQVGHEVHNG